MKAVTLSLALAVLAVSLAAQNPPPAQQSGTPQTTPAPGGQRQGGRGRGVQIMSLESAAWKDGGLIPQRHAQMADEVSPALTWSNPPENTQSFVLIFHDIDATNTDATSDTLLWMVWNIPGTARGLPEHVPHGPQLPDGSRQISVSGPYYRGPAVPPAGPMHHYVFDLYALDSMIDVPPAGQSVPLTRTAVMTAMAGHVRGKASLFGLYR